MVMTAEKYDLAELLRTPDKPLTKEQYENWHKYLRPINDDVSASDVDIRRGVEEIIAEMDRRGTCCW